MLFLTLARKSYIRNLQFRASHLVQNLASAIFGFIYISIWTGIGESRSLGEYGLSGMISYIAFNQASIWISGFPTNGLGMEASVRSGQIAMDLMRPVHLFYHLMSKEWGQTAYQLVYKFIPIYILYFFVLPLHVPDSLAVVAGTALALVVAGYIAICLQYLIGAASLWTTESSWLVYVNYAFSMLLSGFLIPVEWLPGPLCAISAYSFYPYLHYVPTRIYLGMDSVSLLAGGLLWCAALTLLCVLTTRLMRYKVEVQGG
ncbi:ABC transporter permease [Paenibacillus sp. 1P07SE]|uniref:ABC transporter permease n=1 Tax=Paenibacillus sp. 1P07SE TaxID=3132209 RepID=UPI0039A6DF22